MSVKVGKLANHGQFFSPTTQRKRDCRRRRRRGERSLQWRRKQSGARTGGPSSLSSAEEEGAVGVQFLAALAFPLSPLNQASPRICTYYFTNRKIHQEGKLITIVVVVTGQKGLLPSVSTKGKYENKGLLVCFPLIK